MTLEMWLTCRQASSSAFQKHTICQASLWRWRHCRGKIKHYLTWFMHKTALYVFTPTCMWITSNFSWMHTVSKVWSQWGRSFCCQTITYHKVGFCILERFSLFWQAFATTRWEKETLQVSLLLRIWFVRKQLHNNIWKELFHTIFSKLTSLST